MAEYISGEQHREMMASHGSKSAVPKPLLIGVAIIVLMEVYLATGANVSS